MKKSISLFVLSLIFLSACKQSTEPQPPEQKPPGRQEEIPWPSLADSPWPITFGDPQRTNRSKSTGATTGVKEVIDLPAINGTGIAIGPDSTIYYTAVGIQESDTSGLVALFPNGKVKWIYPFKVCTSCDPMNPVVRNDGVIYVSSRIEKKLFAIKPDGNLLWEADNISPVGFANLGKDGNLLFTSFDGYLYSVSTKGEIVLQIKLDSFYPDYRYCLSTDGDNLIFWDTHSKTIKSWNISSQSFNWTTEKEIVVASLMLDNDNNVYVHANYLDEDIPRIIKLDSKGNELWSVKFKKDAWGAFSLDKNGNCVAAFKDTLYSFDYNGKINWKTPLNNNINGLVSIDQNNNIYLAVSLTFFDENITYLCFDSNGNKIWEVSGSENNFYGQEFPNVPAFGKTYFIGYNNNKLVIIK